MTTRLRTVTPFARSPIVRREKPNPETIRAMQEAEGILSGSIKSDSYDSFDAMLQEVLGEMEEENCADGKEDWLLQG